MRFLGSNSRSRCLLDDNLPSVGQRSSTHVAFDRGVSPLVNSYVPPSLPGGPPPQQIFASRDSGGVGGGWSEGPLFVVVQIAPGPVPG